MLGKKHPDTLASMDSLASMQVSLATMTPTICTSKHAGRCLVGVYLELGHAFASRWRLADSKLSDALSQRVLSHGALCSGHSLAFVTIAYSDI